MRYTGISNEALAGYHGREGEYLRANFPSAHRDGHAARLADGPDADAGESLWQRAYDLAEANSEGPSWAAAWVQGYQS